MGEIFPKSVWKEEITKKYTSDFKWRIKKKDILHKLDDERKEKWHWCVDEFESFITAVSENIALFIDVIRSKIWSWGGRGVKAL